MLSTMRILRQFFSLKRVLKIFLIVTAFLSLGIVYKLHIWFYTCGVSLGEDDDGHPIYPCLKNATVFNTPFIVMPHALSKMNVSPHLFSVFDQAHFLASTFLASYILTIIGLIYLGFRVLFWTYARTCGRCRRSVRKSARQYKTQRVNMRRRHLHAD